MHKTIKFNMKCLKAAATFEEKGVITSRNGPRNEGNDRNIRPLRHVKAKLTFLRCQVERLSGMHHCCYCS